MALRREDLYQGRDAVVLEFPVRIARARAVRARRARAERHIALWIAALGLTGAVVAGSALSGSPDALARPGSPSVVTVQAGETVWDLAERYAAQGSDPRALADEIIELNGVQGVVPPGTQLRLP